MITKAYFSDKPEKVRYRVSNGYADVWLRDNIECEETEYGPQWSADENYFRVKARSMPQEFVEQNFDTLFASDIDCMSTEQASLEQRVADLEAIIADLLFGGIHNE